MVGSPSSFVLSLLGSLLRFTPVFRAKGEPSLAGDRQRVKDGPAGCSRMALGVAGRPHRSPLCPPARLAVALHSPPADDAAATGAAREGARWTSVSRWCSPATAGPRCRMER